MKRSARGLFMISCLAATASAVPAFAGPASGSVKSPTGTISPKQAIAYAVRDMRNARNSRIEVMLTDVAVDTSSLADDLDRHMTAINFKELSDRNYVLLWIAPDNNVSMNATYSKTMTQYVNDISGGLKAELTTNTPTKVEGRVFSPSPLKTFDGETYTVDVKFSADVIPALTGTALPAGGGDPAKALATFLAAVKAKNWPGIKAGFSPKALPMWDKDYNTPQENAESVADIFTARLPMQNLKVTGGQLLNPTTAVLEVEGERFGSRNLALVKMVKTGAAWQFEESAPMGMVR
jgi:hypothetical protein